MIKPPERLQDLLNLYACLEARNWLRVRFDKGWTPDECWQKCQNGAWLIWLLWRIRIPFRQKQAVARAIYESYLETELANLHLDSRQDRHALKAGVRAMRLILNTVEKLDPAGSQIASAIHKLDNMDDSPPPVSALNLMLESFRDTPQAYSYMNEAIEAIASSDMHGILEYSTLLAIANTVRAIFPDWSSVVKLYQEQSRQSNRY